MPNRATMIEYVGVLAVWLNFSCLATGRCAQVSPASHEHVAGSIYTTFALCPTLDAERQM